MGPKPAVTDYSKATSAKEVFDEIGEQIQQKVYNSAIDYINELKGYLNNVKFSNGETVTTHNACKLDHTHDTTVSWGESYPCEKRSSDRFSDEGRSQCSTSRISGNNNHFGACAPYRKLQLCDYNLEKITDTNVTNTHNLLVDVLLAAKHEGESIIDNYPSDHHNKEGICTALARSFADIGDIVRGKDLYIGNRNEKEKVKLQNNLKSIFQKIYGELRNSDAIERYKDGSGNFFKLREDWWNINRKKVWDAITCGAPNNAEYFRNTCSNGEKPTGGKCHCIDQTVPTYFDYVPQYLRWFEEWAEDFCRKKKKKVENLEKSCRGTDSSGNERYCSRNGYDCEETIREIELLRMGKQCTNCLYACNRYVEWMDNKKKEFEKQKKKCQREIYGNNESQGSSSDKINNLYYDDFYKELKQKYSRIEKFLRLLNQDAKCKNLENDEENKVDFTNTDDNDDKNKTFSGSQYCKPCPQCGVDCYNKACTPRDINDAKCRSSQKYIPTNNAEETDIKVLSSGEKREDIIQKLKDFCVASDMSKLTEEWKCYYEDKEKGACLLENKKDDKGTQKQKSFYDFFTYWVAHMLKDSEDWKTKLSKCLKYNKKQCISKCNGKCDCYKRWVEQKQKEWDEIKQHYEKQDDLPLGGHYVILEGVLELEFSEDITKAYSDPEQMEKIRKILEKKKKEREADPSKDKTIIDFLLDHEKEEAEECLEIHEDEDEGVGDGDDECDADHEETHDNVRYNPCSGGTHYAMANKVAADMHLEARQQLGSRAGGRKTLRADASQGHYNGNGNVKNLNGEICSIDEKYSNAESNKSKDPCNNKGVRFKIEEVWKNARENGKVIGVYLPPRREHMCTSNLERLDDGSVTKGGKAMHLLLGDVILTAKMDADEIIKRYKDQNNIQLTDRKHLETICRAVRYSFADLGDIIRGRDMWENGEAKQLQNDLETIFEKIKRELNSTNKDTSKYSSDDEKIKPPYKLLREDWWTANRRQVWKAMQCALKGEKINCGATPYDDYIPQRLRWMTEWAEWFCKMQKEEYDELERTCRKCKEKGDKECTKETQECALCKAACDKYKEEIEKWNEQWRKISDKYNLLYLQARIVRAGTVLGDDDPDYQQVVHFFKELQKANGVNTPTVATSSRAKRDTSDLSKKDVYSSAEGYVHQEAYIGDCKEQYVFCEKKHGDTSSTATNNGKYAFKHPPKGYEKACSCEDYYKAADPQDDACTIVEKLLKDKNEISEIDICKKNQDEQWKCGDTSLVKDEGVCMPPRRQNLCVHYLTKLRDDAKEEDLREAFIKCAAAETFLSLQYYNSNNVHDTELLDSVIFIKCAAAETFLSLQYYNSNNVHDTELLDSVIIPPEFLRFMFYTFGDYRDLCLGKNIVNDMSDVESKIKGVFSKPHGKSPDGLTREYWWNEYGSQIWKGMLCALSYDTTKKKMDPDVQKELNSTYNYHILKNHLENFAERPTFLRWFTEWSDEFCQEQKKEYSKLVEGCKEYECNGENVETHKKEQCTQACTTYKEFITKWKGYYDKQSEKYFEDNKEKTFEYTSAKDDVNSSSHAYEYLKKALQNLCPDGSCNCMEQTSEQHKDATDASSAHIAHMPASLDDVPHDYKNKCTCPVGPPPLPPVDPIPKKEEKPSATKRRKPRQPKEIDFPTPALKNAISGDIPLNTQPNTLYFNKPEEKPFIMSIHDRNLYSGEEYSYNVNMVNSMNDIPINRDNNVYSGIDLINDALNGDYDIYDEMLKRKENELFGTNHPKHTNTHNVTKSSNSDPIMNQLDLLHKWLDRHRDMCEKWNNKEEVLDKLKEKWENETHSDNIPSDKNINSDNIPTNNRPSDIHTSDNNKTLNTDVSIQIHMDNPKPINQFNNMDTILEDLDKYNEPYYDYKLKWM
ncbi:hypothetical protein C923_02114 [Plasmodium falciparum UGT5.1]|uniref:Erythrocyte membrane protein 1 n=1 Tax=Plasmodium falciparum UGT5.1 TaxID=1237627 RepID=W7JQB1_PLAFA|nr:hypothetical protein C923_02114 [Plasmodium falciparum UGT5.1]